jgi:hypothetical protein
VQNPRSATTIDVIYDENLQKKNGAGGGHTKKKTTDDDTATTTTPDDAAAAAAAACREAQGMISQSYGILGSFIVKSY